MDRARKNGMVGNNYVQNLIFKKNRADHIARIKKIKSRKPGSSKTLDNSPPVIVKACLTNPRKAALKDQFNFVTERENRYVGTVSFDAQNLASISLVGSLCLFVYFLYLCLVFLSNLFFILSIDRQSLIFRLLYVNC